MKNIHIQVTELLPYYAAGTATPAELRAVEGHLAECPACQLDLQEWCEIGRNVRMLAMASRRQVSLPPLKLPPLPETKPSALPVWTQTHQGPTLSEKLLTFLRVKLPAVEKGKVTMKGYPNREDEDLTGQGAARPKGFYRVMLGGLVTASLVAMLVLLVAIANRPDNPTTGANTTTSNLGASATQAVPTIATPTKTPAPTVNPVGFSGKLVSTITYKPVDIANAPVPEQAGQAMVAGSPDGKTVAVSVGGTVKLWKTADGSLIKTVELPGNYSKNVIWTSLAWSPDNQTLAVAYYYQQNSGPDNSTGQVQFWTATGELKTQLAGLTDEVDIINWSPDGKFFLTTSHKYNGKADQHNMRLWDKDGKQVRVLMQDAPLPAIRVAWSPDSQLIAATVENGNVAGPLALQLWQSSGQLLTSFTDLPKTSANGLAWSPDSKYLAVGLVAPSNNLWLFNRQELLAKAAKPWVALDGHTDVVLQVAWSADSKTLASSSMDHTMRLWDAVNGKALTSLSLTAGEFGEVGLAWSPDGNLLAIGTSGNQVQVVDKTGKNVATLSEPGKVNSLQWAADGKTLMSIVEGGTIHIWQK